jgi:hypothetical protein
MRSMVVTGVACALLFAAAAQGQSAVSAGSDSWSAPARAGSVSYGSSASVPREQAGSFRFKDDDKAYKSRIQMQSPKRTYGRPERTCELNPSASSCLIPSTKPASVR